MHDLRTAAARVRDTLEQGRPEEYRAACDALFMAYRHGHAPVTLPAALPGRVQ